MTLRSLRQGGSIILSRLPVLAVALVLGAAASPPDSRFREAPAFDFQDQRGFAPLFDGQSLAGWDGDPTVWRVEDGAIVGRSSADHPVGHSYLVWMGRPVRDFDLKFEIKVEGGGGSGMQYRSRTGDAWHGRVIPGVPSPDPAHTMTGPQADFWFPVAPRNAQWTGQFYSENTPLGIIAWRGEVVRTDAADDRRLVGSLGDRAELGGLVKVNDWNQYLIIARGGVMMHILNGRLMSVLVDDDPASSNNQPGRFGIELEGTPSRVSVRNIALRPVDGRQGGQ